MTELLRKPWTIVVALALTFSTLPAHATKWASASLHTKQPIAEVFERTGKLIESKEWYVGTRWHIRAADPRLNAIRATTVSFGQKWGDIYVWMKPEGTGTSIQVVMTLNSEAHLHLADYAARFAKALKKLFPDLTYEIERDRTPTKFYFGIPQVFIPIAPSAVVSAQPSVDVTQNVAITQIVQIGPPTNNVFSAFADWAVEREELARQKDEEVDTAKVNSAVQQALTDAAHPMSQYLSTVGKESAEQFSVAAKSINDARDTAYRELANPFQRARFNSITNEYMRTFERQMSDHAKEQASSYQEASKKQVADDLHRALDSWYANGKDWTKIPSEIWNKLPERDKGRLKTESTLNLVVRGRNLLKRTCDTYPATVVPPRHILSDSSSLAFRTFARRQSDCTCRHRCSSARRPNPASPVNPLFPLCSCFASRACGNPCQDPQPSTILASRYPSTTYHPKTIGVFTPINRL